MARPPLDQIDASAVALIKPSALGDIVHSLPILHALRVRFPQASITWVVNRSYAPLIAAHPDLDDVIEFDRRRGLVDAPRLIRELRRRRFDLAIDLQGLLRTGIMTRATGAPRRVGLSSAREGSRCAYTDIVQVSGEMHAVDRYWMIAQQLGVGDIDKRFDLVIDADAAAFAARELALLPRPWLVVSPGSRWLTKRWLPESFADLIRHCQKTIGGSAVLIGSSDEADLGQRVIERLTGPAKLLAGLTTLPQLTAVIARADVMLSNDSGPLHLAAALGRPIVAPYTCTQIARHGPYARPGAVATSVHCAGSYLKRCDRLDCMRELSPDRLRPALDEALRTWKLNCRSV